MSKECKHRQGIPVSFFVLLLGADSVTALGLRGVFRVVGLVLCLEVACMPGRPRAPQVGPQE